MSYHYQTHTEKWFNYVIPNFRIHEFAENPVKYSDPHALICLQDLRIDVASSIYPSLANGAVARFDGSKTSRHYVDTTLSIPKYSTAFDLFFKADPAWVFHKILINPSFRGIGVYFDTRNNKGKDQIMFHVDTRIKETTWCRIDGEYFYVKPYNNTLKKMFTLLGK